MTKILVIFCEAESGSFIDLELEDPAEIALVLSFHGKYLGDNALSLNEEKAFENYFFGDSGNKKYNPTEEPLHDVHYDHIILTGVWS
jgi:hypothetical protein